jgi:tryptophan-rich sensory protein
MSHWIILILSVGIPLFIGFAGALLTTPQIPNWYAGLNKPPWNPPNWVFGPVWTVLYILMGVSLYLVWTADVDENIQRPALVLFFLQLALNFCWSLIFFNRHHIGAAFAGILTLWVLIFLTILAFGSISTLAAWLMVPYIAWVSFASALNYQIWKLNKK